MVERIRNDRKRNAYLKEDEKLCLILPHWVQDIKTADFCRQDLRAQNLYREELSEFGL